MFQKLKNKIGEELKQSPLRLTASVQQLAQAMSPSASANSLADSKAGETSTALQDTLNVSSDFFSIADEQDTADSTKRMHTVDLTATSPTTMPPRSRRDSLSSIASDVSSLYPIHDSQLNLSSLQGEWDSELDDSATTQLERVSKEQLYQGYRKLLYGYNKYKGRFVDLSKQHRDLQFEYRKTKNVLQESQDKALRRADELREQCQLEQKAKAHLEESLRNELEERDHKIGTLQTKIKLLRPNESSDLILIDGANTDTSENDDSLERRNKELTAEVEKLKKLVQSFHSLPNGPSSESTDQVKETITQLKSGIVRMKSENENISNLLSKSPSTSDAGSDIASLMDLSSTDPDEKDKRIEKLSTILLKCKSKINSLTIELTHKEKSVIELTEKVVILSKEKEEVNEKVRKFEEELKSLKLKEEESDLTIAESKMEIHRELELKEKQIKDLKHELEDGNNMLKEIKAKAEGKYKHYEEVILNLKDAVQKATEDRSSTLEMLKKDMLNNANSKSTAIDLSLLEKEKRRLEFDIDNYLKAHMNKLNEVMNGVNEKLSKAEANLVRLCADKLITNRETEMELQEKIGKLESELTELTIKSAKWDEVETDTKNFEELVAEKDRIIAEKTQCIENMNVELNDNIDRIVVLGAELEEANAKHNMLLETYDTKCLNLTKMKTDLDSEIAIQKDKYTLLVSQLEALTLENSNLKSLNEELLKANDNFTNQLNTAGQDCESIKLKLKKTEDILSEEQLKANELVRKLKESEDRIEALSANAGDVNREEAQKLQDLEKQLGEMVKVKEKLENDLDQLMREKEAVITENGNLSIQLKTILQEKAAADEHIERVKGETAEIRTKCELLAKEKSELEGEKTEWQDRCREKEGVLAVVQQEVEGFKKLEQHRLQLISDNEAMQEKINESQVMLANEKEISKKCQIELSDFRSRLQLQEETIRKMSADLEEKSKQIDKLITEVNAKEMEKSAIAKKFQTLLEEERQKSETMAKKLENSGGTLKDSQEEKEKLLSSYEKRIADLKADHQNLMDSLNNKIEALRTSHEELSEEKKQLENSLRDKSANIEKLICANSELSNKVSATEETQRQLDEASALCKAKDKEINRLQQIQIGVDLNWKNSQEEMENKFKSLAAESNTKVKNLVEQLEAARKELDERRANSEEEAAKLKDDSESKVNILKSEIKFMNDKFEAEIANMEEMREREVVDMRSKLDHAEAMAAELLAKLEFSATEKEELMQQYNEKTLKVGELESHLSELKSDLDKNFNETSKISSATFEEMYEERLKKIVGEYELQISNRDERIRECELNLSDNADALESLSSLRSELKNLRNELKMKDDLIESKIEEIESLRKDSENRLLNASIDKDDILETEAKMHEDRIAAQREQWQKRLADEEAKWKKRLEEENEKAEHSIKDVREKYEERLKGMQNEWATERKMHDTLETIPLKPTFENSNFAELECTSKVAVAAVGSSTGSIDMLRKEIMKQAEDIKELKKQHKREVLELGKLAALRARRMSEREGEDVEYEYLRNILYEYMMGREQMVLAKVLAAIVKFDHQQTHNILERQASVGTLRIL